MSLNLNPLTPFHHTENKKEAQEQQTDQQAETENSEHILQKEADEEQKTHVGEEIIEHVQKDSSEEAKLSVNDNEEKVDELAEAPNVIENTASEHPIQKQKVEFSSIFSQGKEEDYTPFIQPAHHIITQEMSIKGR